MTKVDWFEIKIDIMFFFTDMYINRYTDDINLLFKLHDRLNPIEDEKYLEEIEKAEKAYESK